MLDIFVVIALPIITFFIGFFCAYWHGSWRVHAEHIKWLRERYPYASMEDGNDPPGFR